MAISRKRIEGDKMTTPEARRQLGELRVSREVTDLQLWRSGRLGLTQVHGTTAMK